MCFSQTFLEFDLAIVITTRIDCHVNYASNLHFANDTELQLSVKTKSFSIFHPNYSSKICCDHLSVAISSTIKVLKYLILFELPRC
jgi:hypothetical protein